MSTLNFYMIPDIGSSPTTINSYSPTALKNNIKQKSKPKAKSEAEEKNNANT